MAGPAAGARRSIGAYGAAWGTLGRSLWSVAGALCPRPCPRRSHATLWTSQLTLPRVHLTRRTRSSRIQRAVSVVLMSTDCHECEAMLRLMGGHGGNSIRSTYLGALTNLFQTCPRHAPKPPSSPTVSHGTHTVIHSLSTPLLGVVRAHSQKCSPLREGLFPGAPLGPIGAP